MTGGARRHITQFDGLRGVAVLLVLAEHFTFNDWVRSWSPGSAGVRIFFVLSGFLITGILLGERDRDAPAAVARRFFYNRALRLLPAFGVAVAVAALLGIAGMRKDWVWHLSYLSNVQVMLERNWTGAGHFWTLAVEQQFYLLWFPLVVLAPKRWLWPLVLACLVAAPLFRGLIVAGGTPFLNVLLPAQTDALALGAVIALCLHGPVRGGLWRRFGHGAVLWPLVVVAVATSAPWPGLAKPLWLSWVVQPAVVALAAGSAVAAVAGDPARLGWLKSRWLVGLGQISYGLYVFHYFVPQALNRYVPFVAGLTEGWEKLLRLVLWLLVSLALAAASWRWLEQPALRRKDRLAKGPEKDDPMPAKAVI